MGRNRSINMESKRWYKYIIGSLLIFMLFLGLSIFFKPVLTPLLQSKKTLMHFVGVNLSFTPLLISTLIIMKKYHQENIPGITNYKQILSGFRIWMIIQFIDLTINLIFFKDTISLTLDIEKMLSILLLSLLLTPIQTFTEELIFRGYIFNLIKSITKNKIVLLIIPALLFALPHLGNPEAVNNKLLFFLVYLEMALFLGFMTIKKGGLEYSFGIHLANNLFGINILNYPNSALPTAPILTLNKALNPVRLLISLSLSILIILIMEMLYDKKRNI
ncbi:MAG: hypothetical protein B6229_06905 [Spirochaetaceae bacterium 4572_7]|nr:MAG: hypothetical protein B6229_06905 [Spirochaetaceae bacterium 4572_7]